MKESEQEELVSEIIKLIESKYAVGTNNKGVLTIGGHKCSSHLNTFVNANKGLGVLPDLSKYTPVYRKTIWNNVFASLDEKYKGLHVEHPAEPDPTAEALGKYRLVVNVSGEGEVLVLDQNYASTGITDKGLSMMYGVGAFSKAVIAQKEGFLFRYNPTTLTRIIEEKDSPFPILNTYTPPFWRTEEPLPPKEIPEVLKKHFKYFTPDEDSRHFLFCWLRTAIFSRCETYLLLLGAKGTGKTMLGSILKRAVGSTNFATVQRSFLTKEFNSIIRGKQALFLDEIVAKNLDAKEKLKAYANKTATLESKGVEATEEEEIFASFIIANNSKTNIRLECDDRRFSCLDMTETPMVEVFEEDYISELNERILNDDQLISDFVAFLYYYDTKGHNPFVPFMGKAFKEVVLLSLNKWQQKIHEALLSRAEVEYSYDTILLSRNSRYMEESNANTYKVAKFLKEFKYEGEPIGHLEITEEEKNIIPCKALMPINDGFEEL